MNNLEDQLRQIEKDRARLDDMQKALEEQIRAESEAEQKLEGLFQESGFPTPRALIVALMRKYGVRVSGAQTEGRRKRTKVTAALRDEIKSAVEGGLSKNAACKKFEVSYLVVNKIMGGQYDQL